MNYFYLLLFGLTMVGITDMLIFPDSLKLGHYLMVFVLSIGFGLFIMSPNLLLHLFSSALDLLD